MVPSGRDVYNVRANGGMAAGESEHIRESHKNTLKTSRIPWRAYSIVLGPRLLNGGGTRNKFLCLRKMYAISILTYYLYLYQTGDRKHNHLWSERGGVPSGGGVAARQHEFPSQSITQLLHDILVSLSCGVAVVPRRAVVVGVVAYHWRERIHRIVSSPALLSLAR